MIRELTVALRTILEAKQKPYEVEAQKLGGAARKAGMARTPALDKSLGRILSSTKGASANSKDHINAMTAWMRGWDIENMKDKG